MSLRVGIVGLGRIGRQQIACLRDMHEFELAAVADPELTGSSILPRAARTYRDWAALVSDERIDAVSICTPHDLHAPIIRAALDAGKHVLVEKPLALTINEARQLVGVADRLGRCLMVELTHRFYPPILNAMCWVREGRLGKIFAVEDRIIEPAGGQISSWLRTKATAGGGVALTSGIHMLDRIAAVLGEPLRFVAGTAGVSGALGDVEDTATMLLTSRSGVPVQFLAAWPVGSGPCDDELTVYGSLGTLRVWAWQGWSFESLDPTRAPERHECYSPAEDTESRVRIGIRSALQEFAAAIVEHRAPTPAAADALAAEELVEQFYQHTGLSGDGQ